jgi:uncharacterized repeat protein (TIGR01451 family)
MKKITSILFSLTTGIILVTLLMSGLATTAHASQAASLPGEDAPPGTPAGDPEPPVEPSPDGITPPEEEAPQDLDDISWTSPYTDITNSAAWGDYDMDGDLDLLLGNDGVNRLYNNDGATLVDSGTTYVCQSAGLDDTQTVAWSDFDLDGDLDFLIANYNAKSCVYKYDSVSGTFTLAWLATTAQTTEDAAWAGWETAGELNVYLGLVNVLGNNNVFKAEGGSFDLWWTSPSNTATALAWGDYDNDGDPDLAIGNFGEQNVIYENSTTSLTPVFTTTHDYRTQSLAWGDMTGDGYLDLAVGNGGSGGTFDPDQVYCNSGPPGYTLTECWTSDELVATHGVAWGDWDGDGDLDLVLTSEENGETRLYENEGGTLDDNPAWDANDEFDESRGVAWGDPNGDGDLELVITYQNRPTVIWENTEGAMSATSIGPTVLDSRAVAWGDFDGDGWLDLAVANSNNTANYVYKNTAGTLSLFWTSPQTDNSRSVAWGDYDGDGDLDLAFGNGLQGSGQANRLYRNTGGTFVLYAGFTDASPSDTYSVAWGDYDGDQDLDLAAGNYDATQPIQIHINRGGVFTQTALVGPATDKTWSVAWGDFDQDYDLDLLVGNDAGANRVYQNDGTGGFTQITLPLPDAPCTSDTRSIAWADWDGDGDLDIAVGNAGGSGCVQIIQAVDTLQPHAAWSFVTAYQTTDTNLDVRSLAWGDYDGDGDLDLAVAITGDFGRRSRIYQNNGGSLTDVWRAPIANNDPARSAAWGDVDNDGDLDLALANGLTPNQPNRIFINQINSPANLPNNLHTVSVLRPDLTDNAYYFSAYEIVGLPKIIVPYILYDDESDRAYQVDFEVSWDGGGNWEEAWPVTGHPSHDGVTNLAASPSGVSHTFVWDAFHQLLDHQGLPFNPGSNIYPAAAESFQEMDVVFRVRAWSNPDHGGYIQRPSFGGNSSQVRVDARPDWFDSIKAAGQDYVQAGDPISFTVTITQNDHGQPENAWIIDTFPEALNLYNPPVASSGTITWSQDAITWTGDLEFEQVLELYFEPKVTRPLTNGTLLQNCANVYDGMHQPFQRCDTFIVSSTAILTESYKLVNGVTENSAELGELMTYTLIVTNTGNENSYDVFVTDVLPEQVIYAGYVTATSGIPAFSNGAIYWFGDVRVFEPVTITYRVTVGQPLRGGTLITNTFEIEESDIVTPHVIGPPVTTTVIAPNLGLSEKTASEPYAELADVITYTISLQNTGPRTAYSVTLADVIPEGMTYISPSLTYPSGSGGYISATRTITWFGDVAAFSQVDLEFSVYVEIPDPPVQVLTFTNWVNFEDELSGAYVISHTLPVELPDLSSAAKLVSHAVASLGDVVHYTIALTNTGGKEPGVHIVDAIPAGATYIPASLTFSNGTAVYSPTLNSIIWDVDVAGHTTSLLEFDVYAGLPPFNTNGKMVNAVTFVDTTNTVWNLSAVTTIPRPDLEIEKYVNESNVSLDDVITYTLVFSNTGGFSPGTAMTDLLQQGLVYVPGSFSSVGGSGSGGYNSATKTIFWNGSVDNGETVTATFAATVSCPADPPNVPNTGIVTDPLLFTDQDSVTIHVDMPDLSDSTLDASINGIPQPLQVFEYEIKIENDGGYAPGAWMTSKLSDDLVWTGNASSSLGVVTYNALDHQMEWSEPLPAGAVVNITFEVQVVPNPAGNAFANTTTISDGCGSIVLTKIFGYTIFLPVIQRD